MTRIGENSGWRTLSGILSASGARSKDVSSLRCWYTISCLSQREARRLISIILWPYAESAMV